MQPCRFAVFAQVPLAHEGAEGSARRFPHARTLALRNQRCPSLEDGPTDVFQGECDPKPLRASNQETGQVQGCLHPACMGKDAILSRTLTHA